MGWVSGWHGHSVQLHMPKLCLLNLCGSLVNKSVFDRGLNIIIYYTTCMLIDNRLIETKFRFIDRDTFTVCYHHLNKRRGCYSSMH